MMAEIENAIILVCLNCKMCLVIPFLVTAKFWTLW